MQKFARIAEISTKVVGGELLFVFTLYVIDGEFFTSAKKISEF